MIIQAVESDREELLNLYRSQIGKEFCPWSDDYPGDDTITFDLSRDALFVMKKEGKIIASVSIDEDEDVSALECWSEELSPGGELARLCVSPDFQNRGIGKMMLEYGMKELKKRGYKSTHFLVNKHNIKALKSYSVFNLNQVGECHMFGQDFICFEMELLNENINKNYKKITMDFYNNHALEFAENTIDVEFSKQQNNFLKNLPKGGKILDLGCKTG